MNDTTTSPRCRERLLAIADVAARTSISRSGIYAAIASGTFPSPVKIGAKSAWVEAEVADWIDQRIAERDARNG